MIYIYLILDIENQIHKTEAEKGEGLPLESREIKLLIILLVFLMFALLLAAVIKIRNIRRDLRYVKMELSRAEGEEERDYWKKKLKILRLSFLPGFTPERAERLLSWPHRQG